jgi:hypothetical protein
LWYNKFDEKIPQEYNTPYQLKFPIEIEKIIETTDPVYTFCEVIDHIDLNKYLTTEERRTGRPRYDEKTLTKSNTVRIHGKWL